MNFYAFILNILDFNTILHENTLKLNIFKLNNWNSNMCSPISCPWYRSFLNSCQIPWKIHIITCDLLNSGIVDIAGWNGAYSAWSSSVSTRRFITHTLEVYNDENANLYIALNTSNFSYSIWIYLILMYFCAELYWNLVYSIWMQYNSFNMNALKFI